MILYFILVVIVIVYCIIPNCADYGTHTHAFVSVAQLALVSVVGISIHPNYLRQLAIKLVSMFDEMAREEPNATSINPIAHPIHSNGHFFLKLVYKGSKREAKAEKKWLIRNCDTN